MDELLGSCLGIAALVGIAMFAIYYAVWIALAFTLDIFAWVLFFWALAFSLTLIGGIVFGFVTPFRVLRGSADTQAEIATPDLVVANRVMKFGPRGFTKHYGWDHAWPTYMPFQATRDATAVAEEIFTVLSTSWEWVQQFRPSVTVDATSRVKAVGFGMLRSLPGVLWLVIVPIPFLGLLIGAWGSFAIWTLMMILVGGLAYVTQQAITLTHRLRDRIRIRSRRGIVLCPSCYESAPRPSYRCPNEECTVVHRELSPGPLGVLNRRCSCGVSLPTTIGRASTMLTPICPVCNEQLADGSGARHTFQLPVFGAVGAGKTRLLSASAFEADQQIRLLEGKLDPLTRESTEFVVASKYAITKQIPTAKTGETHRPIGHPVQLTDKEGVTVEIQFIDAAGEKFANWHTTQELTYMDSAEVLLFVIDPLALPRVAVEWERAKQAPGAPTVAIAASDQEDAYASVVDRLRAQNVRLSKRSLGVVISKFDILRSLPIGRFLAPESNESLRSWLSDDVDQFGLVRRMESDFGDVRFFAVDSLNEHDRYSPVNPLSVLQWVLDKHKSKLVLLPPPEPVATSATQPVGA